MNGHEHRPTFLSFTNTKRVCRCRECQQPLRCTNRYLYVLSLLPALPAFLYVFVAGLEHWPVLLAAWALCTLLQYLAFRRLHFEIDLVAQRDDRQNSLRRR